MSISDNKLILNNLSLVRKNEIKLSKHFKYSKCLQKYLNIVLHVNGHFIVLYSKNPKLFILTA